MNMGFSPSGNAIGNRGAGQTLNDELASISVHRSSFIVHRSIFIVHRSSFDFHRS